MKSAVSRAGRGRLIWALGLQLALTGPQACQRVEKLGIEPYNAFVEKASAEDRLRIASVLAEVASAYGLKSSQHSPDTLALFVSPPSEVGLSMVAGDNDGNGDISITVVPVALGLKPNAQRSAMIAAVDAGLSRAFGDRLKK